MTDAAAKPCLSRRHFLLSGASVVATVTLPGLAHAAELVRASFPRRRIASLATLQTGVPVEFAYPYPDVINVLVRLGVPAGGGVGPQRDIVAFNQHCTHMGGPLAGTYQRELQMLGPCPLHLTTFDLTRHGMVVSGHATASLPQIELALEGDAVVATGVLGLVYGYSDMRRGTG